MYSPKIKDNLINRMFQIKQKTGKPMTKQINEAIREYIVKFEQNENKEASDGRKL